MAEASRRSEAVPSVRCVYCGAEQSAPAPGTPGKCNRCARPLAVVHREAPPVYDVDGEARAQPRAVRTQAALLELIAQGPSNETPRMVGELVDADKRMTSLVAFVPLVGPWLIQRSEAHTPKEKRLLSWISIALTSLVALGLAFMIPSSRTDPTRLQQRFESDTTRLGAFVEKYRRDHGAYPDAAKWRFYVQQADPQFYDPWGRPYRFSAGGEGFTITTLGRDGAEGGSGEDALAFDGPVGIRTDNGRFVFRVIGEGSERAVECNGGVVASK